MKIGSDTVVWQSGTSLAVLLYTTVILLSPEVIVVVHNVPIASHV